FDEEDVSSASFDEFDQSSAEPPEEETSTRPRWKVAASQVTTAAQLAGKEKQQVAKADPNLFKQGMTVKHPEYGPGKIVALSGSGDNRRATVRFATAGEKRFVLAHSPLHPA
ncbi:MAG: hypothetical protein RID07_06575, partial [Lacipirellulaceae bacterium]